MRLRYTRLLHGAFDIRPRYCVWVVFFDPTQWYLGIRWTKKPSHYGRRGFVLWDFQLNVSLLPGVIVSVTYTWPIFAGVDSGVLRDSFGASVLAPVAMHHHWCHFCRTMWPCREEFCQHSESAACERCLLSEQWQREPK